MGVASEHSAVFPVPHALDDVFRDPGVERVARHGVSKAVEGDAVLGAAPFDAGFLDGGFEVAFDAGPGVSALRTRKQAAGWELRGVRLALDEVARAAFDHLVEPFAVLVALDDDVDVVFPVDLEIALAEFADAFEAQPGCDGEVDDVAEPLGRVFLEFFDFVASEPPRARVVMT